MVDGAVAFNFEGPAEGKSLLFPLQPQQGETLPGFIRRSAEANWLQGPRSIRRMAGISPHDTLIAWSHGVHGLINGLLKHFAYNMRRGSDPPTGCDRIWHAVVLERLYSPAATVRWRLEMDRPEMFVIGRREEG